MGKTTQFAFSKLKSTIDVAEILQYPKYDMKNPLIVFVGIEYEAKEKKTENEEKECTNNNGKKKPLIQSRDSILHDFASILYVFHCLNHFDIIYQCRSSKKAGGKFIHQNAKKKFWIDVKSIMKNTS